MNSIQRRLILTLLASLALILAAAGSGIYVFTRAILLHDFNLMLRSTVLQVIRTVRGPLLEKADEERTFSVELSEGLPIYFQAWTPDGRVLGRSASLEKRDLKFSLPKTNEQLLDARLPNGHDARAIVISITLGEEEAARERALKERMEEAMGRRLIELPKSRPIILMVAADRTELDATLQRLSLVLWTVGLLVLALTALVVTWVSRRGLAPLQEVADQAGRIDAAKLDFRFPTQNLPSELASICERLNDLLSRLQASFARERCFTADAAHELRTPITELRSLAEIALKWPSPDPTAAGAFQDVLESAVQMQGIVDGLLAIARCEGGAQPMVREPVAVAELARKVWQSFAPRAAQKKLKVELELADRRMIETDRGMLTCILTNLFSNAVEYTPLRGLLQIRLDDQSADLDFTVTNSVNNLAPEDLSHFFERFWRRDSARSSSEHSGIGLSLSQAYARVLGLDLKASLSAENLLTMRLSVNKSVKPVDTDGRFRPCVGVGYLTRTR
jgi:signal transduction histidine kinase